MGPLLRLSFLFILFATSPKVSKKRDADVSTSLIEMKTKARLEEFNVSSLGKSKHFFCPSLSNGAKFSPIFSSPLWWCCVVIVVFVLLSSLWLLCCLLLFLFFFPSFSCYSCCLIMMSSLLL